MSKHTLSLICMGFCLFSGCKAVGPDYEPPEIEMPDAWHEALSKGLVEGKADLHTWWKSFNDPVLENLIQRAAWGNLTLKEALLRIEEARARRGVAEGEFYPEINADGSFSRARESENVVPNGVRVTDRNLYSVGFDAAWEMDVFGRIRRSVESADAALDASVEDYRDVLVTLYAEVALNYVDVRSLQKRIAIAVANAKSQRDTLNLVQDRFDNGLVPKLDVTQAQSNLATTESTIPFFKAALIQAFNRLSVLMGEHPGPLREELAVQEGASSESVRIPAPPDQVLVGLPADLLRQRPDIRRIERELAAQHAQIGVATADLYPRFSLSGFFAYQARNNEDVLGADSRAYSIGPSIRWNLFDGSRIRNNIRIEEARTEQAYRRYKQIVLLALEETEDFLAAYSLEGIRTETLERAVTATAESVSLVKTLYLDGLTDFNNVLDMQRSLFNQQDLHVESQGQVSKNLISLYKALGGGWNPDSALKEEVVDEVDK